MGKGMGEHVESENIPVALSLDRFEAVLTSISEGVFTVDPQFRITCFNRAAEEITGFKREEAVGRPCHEILQASICEDSCALRYTMKTGISLTHISARITNRKGEEIPVSVSTSLFKDRYGSVMGGVETFRDLRHVTKLRKALERSYSFEDIVSKSPAMKRILDILPTIAASESTVLITGESGTGKELVARAVHNLSSRKREPFVAVNSAGFPETLIESELFGYEAGAFTGANKPKPGRFALAHRGTLFLDEIGDIPLTVQAKLLRVLQEKAFEPLGGVTPVKSDVRIVAATHRDLKTMMEQGSFRKDLYYRINVIEINLPPLRQRMEDVPLLINHFFGQLAALHGKDVAGFSPDALKTLMAYEYPGNVRELQNIVEHAAILCPGPLIERDHLPERLQTKPPSLGTRGSLAEVERQMILNALRNNDWNRKAAAEELHVHKTTLFRKIRRLGIKLPERDGRSSSSR